MKELLIKEVKLASNPLSFLFLLFSLMTFLPGYPILCGAFFICLGIFYTFQQIRENDDITYSVLLPVRKRDVVSAKYLFVVLIQLTGFLLCAAFTGVRQTVLSSAAPYTQNPMMNANAAYLGFVLLIFSAFNVCFLGRFFRTAYKIGMPLILFSVVTLVMIALGETLHHLPGLTDLNNTAGTSPLQIALLLIGAGFYVLGTLASWHLSAARFEKLDL